MPEEAQLWDMVNSFGVSYQPYTNSPLKTSTENQVCVAVFPDKEVKAGSMC